MTNVTGTDRVKRGMAEMQKGGVIMDVSMQSKQELQKKQAQLR